MAGKKRLAGIGEFLALEAGHAVDDIRQRLFEEAWFGRVVTAAPVVDVSKAQDIEPSAREALEKAWGIARHQPQAERPREDKEAELTPELEEALAMESVERWREKEDIDRDFDIDR